MGIYKLFAEKDTTLYSEYNTMNAGLDEVLELTKAESILYSGTSTVARMLVKFEDSQILDIVNNIINTGSFDVYLKMYYADISNIPTNYSLICYPVYESWDMGTGRSGNIPVTTNGASWINKNSTSGSSWSTSPYSAGITGSYLSNNSGGGSWYTGSFSTQSFTEYVSKDICMNVTDIILNYISGSYVNNGFIIMNSGSIEFDVDYLYKLTYFSRDTNTIYPPVLEFRWDDSSYVTGSLVNSSNIYLSFSNNFVNFNSDSIHRFRINARETFPARTFTTSSLFTNTKLLPSSSYYSIRDEKTNDIVIDFDDNYTKISSDADGNYFDLYMNGLQPERYYRILVKTIIENNHIILDDQYFFKVEE